MKLGEKQIMNVHKRFTSKKAVGYETILASPLKETFKQYYLDLFETRINLIKE